MNNPQGWAYNSPSPYPRSLYQQSSEDSSAVTRVTTTIALLVLGYYALNFFELWPSTLKRRTYETFVDLFPKHLIILMQFIMTRVGILGRDTAHFTLEDLTSRQAKSGAFCELLGLENNKITTVVRKARTFSGIDRILPPSTETGPAGLGNWDNSCYQNSVLHGFASLPAFNTFVSKSWDLMRQRNTTGPTHEALVRFLSELRASDQLKRTLWTPAVLKSMDSWQQQDAQEYFSRVLDAVEKEDIRFYKAHKTKDGLEKSSTAEKNGDGAGTTSSVVEKTVANVVPVSVVRSEQGITSVAQYGKTMNLPERNPLDGMLAQSLKCRTCGFSEGLSLTQFNCITVNLGTAGGGCTLEQLLDEYTEPEDIDGVECTQCTKLANVEPSAVEDDVGLERTKVAEPDDSQKDVPSKDSPEEPSTEKSVRKKPKPVLSTKSKQLTIGRLPEDLVIHLNRSIFDMYGNQRKNTAPVDFPVDLKIFTRWCAPLDDLEGNTIQASYSLRCVVTHAGRHDDGHYVAYAKRDKGWYCFNDEVVTKVSEDYVLNRGNVFMLFYEIDHSPIPSEQMTEAAVVLTEENPVGNMSTDEGTKNAIADDNLASAESDVVETITDVETKAEASKSILPPPHESLEDTTNSELGDDTTPSSVSTPETESEETAQTNTRMETKIPPMRTAIESSSIPQRMELSHAAPVF